MHDGTHSGATGKTDSFPIVAVGASAGGLEAFTQLLRSLPDDTGMAFVLIQHLDPKHHSALSELLAKQTGMTVAEAKNGAQVEPNHVYVIPPNANMGIAQLRLRLTPRSAEPGLHTPIDFFMRSLAEAWNSRSIGVVLSGTASDGTRGLAAIKAEGGITFAQDEKSAKYSGMPHSAVASGCVDFVLPPERIAQELGRVSGHPYLGASRTRASRTRDNRTTEDLGFGRIFAVLRKAGGVNFSQYKSGTVQRRTLRRMAIRKIESVSEYAKYVEKHSDEAETLCQDLLIPVTSFFRDLEAFEALKAKVFPAILKDKSAKGAIRIWDPGCSTGEETYSLAMVLLEFLGDRISNLEIQLFGTDANERGVEKARAGLYHERISQEMSPERLRRFFTKV
ncbi:MAG: chemotaxis protein CheB, partial [Candidatus Acidiferrales bacterium]